jgi:hypothetical protein
MSKQDMHINTHTHTPSSASIVQANLILDPTAKKSCLKKKLSRGSRRIKKDGGGG